MGTGNASSRHGSNSRTPGILSRALLCEARNWPVLSVRETGLPWVYSFGFQASLEAALISSYFVHKISFQEHSTPGFLFHFQLPFESTTVISPFCNAVISITRR